MIVSTKRHVTALGVILMEVAVKPDALRRALARKCWYQKDLAQSASVGPSYLSQILRGVRAPSAGVCQRILSSMDGESFDELFEIRE